LKWKKINLKVVTVNVNLLIEKIENPAPAELQPEDVVDNNAPPAQQPAEVPVEPPAESQPIEAPDVKNQEELKGAEEKARKTFITDKKEAEAGEYKLPFTLHDLLIPGGKPAKLAKIPDVSVSDLRIPEILFRFKFRDPTPVILLVGGKGARAYFSEKS